jgi:hypothetical protein
MLVPRLLLALVVSLTSGYGLLVPAAAESAVPRVQNGGEPRDGTEVFALQEQWRVGGEEDEVFFGLVTRIQEDESGNLYVLDAQLSQVQVYAPDGTHQGTLFREGEGPGEVRGPRDLALLVDGRVAVVQEMPGKVICVDRQNRPAGTWRVCGEGSVFGGACQALSIFAGKHLFLAAGFAQSPGEAPGHLRQTNFLLGFSPDGAPGAPFCTTVNDIDLGAFTFEEDRHLASYWWNTAIGPDDRVYVAPHIDRYEIHVFGADGVLERIIEREYEPWKRTAAEREHFTEMVQAIYYGAPLEVGVDPLDHEPAINYLQRGLRVHADGTLWVLTTRGLRAQEPGVFATFDVFSPAGNFVRRVAIRGPWDGRRDGLFLLGEDRAAVITGFVDAMVLQFTGGNLAIDLGGEAGGMEVIHCRLDRVGD